MKVSSTYTIDLIALGRELGVRERDLSCLKNAGVAECEFTFNTPFDSDGCIDGHIMIDHFEFVRQLNIISRALEFPFCMASYKILTRGVLDELEKYTESDEAIVAIQEAYYAEIAQMQYDALCARAENND